MVKITEIKNQRVAAVGEDAGALETLDIMQEGFDKGWFAPKDIGVLDLWGAFTNDANLSSTRACSEAMTTGLFPKAADQWAVAAVQKGYEYGMGDAAKLVTEDNATAEDTPVIGFTAGDEPAQTPDGMPFEETDFVEKYSMIKSYVFGKIVRITRRAVKFDRTGQILRRAQEVGRKLGKHRADFIVTKVCDQSCIAYGEATDVADTAYRYLGERSSNYAVYANSHTNIDGQTNDTLAAGATLTFANIAACYPMFAAMTDEVGDTIDGVDPRAILVPKALVITAAQIVKNIFQHGTGNRNINVEEIQMLDILSHPKLDGFNAATWYMGDFARQFSWLWEERPSMEFQGLGSDAAFTRHILWSWSFVYAGGAGANEYRYVIRNGS